MECDLSRLKSCTFDLLMACRACWGGDDVPLLPDVYETFQENEAARLVEEAAMQDDNSDDFDVVSPKGSHECHTCFPTRPHGMRLDRGRSETVHVVLTASNYGRPGTCGAARVQIPLISCISVFEIEHVHFGGVPHAD